MADATITTFTGKAFAILAPDPAQICIKDIAHGLSMLCRFNGQCSRFYSVADHSVHVSRHVAPDFALWGLLHDAAEAYIGDLPTPLKAQLPEFKGIERRLMAAIAQRYGLPQHEPDEVKAADDDLFDAEAELLLAARLEKKGERTFTGQIECWRPAIAEREFTARFRGLVPSLEADRSEPQPLLELGDAPDFQHAHAGDGAENITPHATLWMGEIGQLDPDKTLSEFGYDEIEPFSVLLQSIIAAYPSDRLSPSERLDKARQAVFGTKPGRGAPAKPDDELLLDIARLYYAAWFNGNEPVELAPLVRAVLPPDTKESYINGSIVRLRQKFLSQKDVLLTRVTSDTEPGRMDMFIQVARIAKIARDRLGVKVDLNTIAPYPRQRR